MTKEHTIRRNLKLALIDLDAARDKRQDGYAAGVSRADMLVLEMNVSTRSDSFHRLIETLVSRASCAGTSAHC
jgi:hypothetical protein